MVESTRIAQSTVTSPMLPEFYRITRRIKETHDIFTLTLEALNGHPSFTFQPGQFNMLYVYGIGEVPISISGDASDSHQIVHTTRAVGTVTKAMSALKTGDRLGLRGPFGTTWPVNEARGQDVVIVAGGVGLPPLRPVIYHILNHREYYGRVVLLYGTRSPTDIVFRKELEAWRSRFDLQVHVTVDYADSSWRGNVGVVTKLIDEASFDSSQCLVMVCGPEVMMRFAVAELQTRGVEPEQIYLSMERNMKCAVGFCGHCQYGPAFVCRDGPVFAYPQMQPWLSRREV